MSVDFNRSNIDHYLYLIAKEYKKVNRINSEAEIIIVGGAAMIMNYNFRDTTTDIDSIIRASSVMKDIINRVGDENGLVTGWLNDDFKKTSSYSPKLIEYSQFYKRFCNCLNVRTVANEYLLAMKVRSARTYKHDLSDVIGIIKEHQEMNKKLDFTLVDKAYHNLYDEGISAELKAKLQEIFKYEDLEELFYSTKEEENANMQAALKAEEIYGGQVNENNVDSFISHFKPEDKQEEKETDEIAVFPRCRH